MADAQVCVEAKYYYVEEATDDGSEEEDDGEDEGCHGVYYTTEIDLFAGPLGLEPRTSRLECDVLPLKLWTLETYTITKSGK